MGGPTGSITCVGAIYGQTIVGPGTFGVDDSYGPGPLGGATCPQSAGSGYAFYAAPTTGGTVQVKAEFAYTAVGLAGTLVDKAGTAQLSGSFVFIPTQGDCVLTPVTAVTVTGSFILSG